MNSRQQVTTGGHHRRFSTTRVVTITTHRNVVRLPDFMKCLNILCTGDGGKKHPLPVRMDYIGSAISTKGYAVAKYRCRLCGRLEIWGVAQNGTPTRLKVIN